MSRVSQVPLVVLKSCWVSSSLEVSFHAGSFAPVGTLHLVDLAGSERVWKAGVASTPQRDPNGARRLREAQAINRSLLALGGVMAALRARRPHVPFRDSQLTRLLQPALGAGTTAILLLQVGPWAGASLRRCSPARCMSALFCRSPRGRKISGRPSVHSSSPSEWVKWNWGQHGDVGPHALEPLLLSVLTHHSLELPAPQHHLLAALQALAPRAVLA